MVRIKELDSTAELVGCGTTVSPKRLIDSEVHDRGRLAPYRGRPLRSCLWRGTIASTLREQGIDPAPERGRRTPWSTFLKAHWGSLAATDFFTVEVCTLWGLVTHHVLFFFDLASRSVKIAGITIHPNDLWMSQVARNLTDAGEQFFHRTRFLIMDRDAKYSDSFRGILTREGLKIIRLPHVHRI